MLWQAHLSGPAGDHPRPTGDTALPNPALPCSDEEVYLSDPPSDLDPGSRTEDVSAWGLGGAWGLRDPRPVSAMHGLAGGWPGPTHPRAARLYVPGA